VTIRPFRLGGSNFAKADVALRLRPMSQLSVTVTMGSDGTVVLSVRGEVDHANSDELREVVRRLVTHRRPHTVRVDLGLVTFIDSGAVGALVAAHRIATTDGARLVVTNASPFVSRQLAIAGVDHLFGAARQARPHHF
jgi:anti-anti-sigma factor